MSLLDDLRNLLQAHHQHVTAQPNQGTAHLIENHLNHLTASDGDDAAHAVLGELYGALNAPVPEVAPAKAPAKKTASAADKA